MKKLNSSNFGGSPRLDKFSFEPKRHATIRFDSSAPETLLNGNGHTIKDGCYYETTNLSRNHGFPKVIHSNRDSDSSEFGQMRNILIKSGMELSTSSGDGFSLSWTDFITLLYKERSKRKTFHWGFTSDERRTKRNLLRIHCGTRHEQKGD